MPVTNCDLQTFSVKAIKLLRKHVITMFHEKQELSKHNEIQSLCTLRAVGKLIEMSEGIAMSSDGTLPWNHLRVIRPKFTILKSTEIFIQ